MGTGTPADPIESLESVTYGANPPQLKDTILQFHHTLRLVVPVVIAINAGYALISWRQERPYAMIHNVLARMNIGFSHLQMFFGIILMIHSTKISYGSTPAAPDSAYWTWTHPILMFSGITCVTLALILPRNHKNDSDKHRLSLILNVLGLAIIVAGQALIPRS